MPGCILEYIGQVAYMAGVHAERQRARDLSAEWIRMALGFGTRIMVFPCGTKNGLLENPIFPLYKTYNNSICSVCSCIFRYFPLPCLIAGW